MARLHGDVHCDAMTHSSPRPLYRRAAQLYDARLGGRHCYRYCVGCRRRSRGFTAPPLQLEQRAGRYRGSYPARVRAARTRRERARRFRARVSLHRC